MTDLKGKEMEGEILRCEKKKVMFVSEEMGVWGEERVLGGGGVEREKRHHV